MEFYFETYYDHAALTAMSRALRKIMRRRKNLIARIFAIAVFLFGVYVSSPLSGKEFSTSPSALLSYMALLLLLTSVLCEDMINGFMAQKRYVDRAENIEAIFQDDHYEIRSDDGITSWQYHGIPHLAETKYFFVFVFNANHAQAFDKDGLSGATVEEFREFIQEKTGMNIIRV